MSSTTPDILVKAGAGTGKTTALSTSVISYAESHLASQGHLPKVLVTTFTRKATQELKERLVRLACEKRKKEILQFVSSPSYLYVSTIHGVLSLFLKRFGPLFDFDPSFTFLDLADAQKIKRQSFRSAMNDSRSQSEDWDLLLNRYTAREMIDVLDRIDQARRTHPSLQPFLISDFNSSFQKINRIFLDAAIDLFSQSAASDNASWSDYSNQVMAIISLSTPDELNYQHFEEQVSSLGRKPAFLSKKPPFEESLKESIDDWFKVLKKRAAGYSLQKHLFKESSETLLAFERVAQVYSEHLERYKKNKNSYEMSDLELLVLDILRKEPTLAQGFSRDWDFVLIDEYQDTSPTQVQILDLIFSLSKKYYVGDPQQSIYLFRGARSEVFENKQNEIANRQGDIRFLNTNYRSTPELLEFINDQTKVLGSEFSQMEPKEKSFKPETIVAYLAPVDKDEKDVYYPLLKHIQKEVAQGARYDDFAVLTRKNSEVKEISSYLELQNLPTQIHLSSGFFDSQEVQDAIAILKFIVLPFDTENLIKMLRAPWFHVDDELIAEAVQALGLTKIDVNWTSLSQRIEHPTIEKLKLLLDLANEVGVYQAWVRSLSQVKIFDVSSHYDSTGRRESNIWKLISLLQKELRQPKFNFSQFLEKIESGESPKDSEEGEAIALIEPNRINIMTVHKAKGLKFNQVLLPNMHRASDTVFDNRHQKGLFVFDENVKKWSVMTPFGEENKKEDLIVSTDWLTQFSEREKQESRRLYYVAITRAAQKCFFTWRGVPEKNSWAEYLQKYISDSHLYRAEHFSVQICDMIRESVQQEAPQLKPKVVEKLKVTQVERTQRLSVSALIEKVTPENRSMQSDSTDLLASLQKPEYGIRLHSAFEKLKYKWDYDFKSESVASGKGQLFIQSVDFVKSLQTPNMKKIIQSGEVEWGFQLKTKIGIIEGQIDLWGYDQGELWVIDYKSGGMHLSEKAFQQLELYAHALMHAEDVRTIKMAIIYPASQQILVREARSIAEVAQFYGF